jgi:hypothetical protein
MMIQTVQEKHAETRETYTGETETGEQMQETRPLRTEVGDDLRNRGRMRCMPLGTEVEGDACS